MTNQRDINRCSHRYPVKHDDNCRIENDCMICSGELFVCADCGAAEAQLEAVHCVDRVKAQWQEAVAIAAETIVINWDRNVTPNRARVRLTALIKELKDRWVRAGATVAQFGISTPLNMAEAWTPNDLAAAINELGGRINRLKNLVAELTTERDVAESQTAVAERRVDDLEHMLAETASTGNPVALNWREGLRRRQAEDKLRRVKEIVNETPDVTTPKFSDHQMGDASRRKLPETEPDLEGWNEAYNIGVCPHCGHRHPPDGGCV